MSRRLFVTNIGWLFGDRIVRLGGGLLVGVWIARYLGPGDFGLLNYTIAFSSLFGILGTLGLDGIVVRELVAGQNARAVLLGTAFRLRILGGVVGLAVAVGLAAATGSTSGAVVMVALGAGVYLMQSFYVIDWYYQAITRNRASVVAQNAGFLFATAVKAVMIVTRMPVIAFAIGNLVEAIIASIIMMLLYRRANRGERWSFDKALALHLLRESWPLILSGLAFMVYVRLDQVMIGQMLGQASVGVYAAAVRISEAWNLVPVVIVTAAYPRLLQIKQDDPAQYDVQVQRLFSVLAAISIAAAIATELLGHRVVLFLYGQPYAEAAAILKISVWSAIFVSVGFASGRWLIAEKLAKFALMRNLIGVAVNAGANLVLIPAYGAKGAAIGTLLSYAFANLLSYVTNRRLHPLFWINLKALLLVGLLPRRRVVA